jgi:hypothetical protein
VFNHTTGQTTKFHDHYEYVNFLPGKPPRDLFVPETGEKACVEAPPRAQNAQQGKQQQQQQHSGGSAGAAVLGAGTPHEWERPGALGIGGSEFAAPPAKKSMVSSPAKTFGVLLLVCGLLGLTYLAVRRRARSSRSGGGGGGGRSGSGSGSPSGSFGVGASGGGPPNFDDEEAGYGRTGSREVLRGSPDSSAI